jgi:hypothetical protein
MSPEAREHSFDELTRGLASGSISRGRALRLMGAALVGSALGSLGGVAAADDECKPAEKKCRKDHQCCSGNCGEDHKCAACPSGTTPCGTQCCQTAETCVNDACCPNARVCGTGTSVTCCTEGQECGGGACCTPRGGSCTTATDCCGGLDCDSNKGTCCSPNVASRCLTNADCCGQLGCTGGFCQRVG